MTNLLPDVVVDAVHDKTALQTSGSFGVVAVLLLVALLLQLEVGRGKGDRPTRTRMLSALAGPLFVAVAVVIGTRVAAFMP
jgi:hypothetical protein